MKNIPDEKNDKIYNKNRDLILTHSTWTLTQMTLTLIDMTLTLTHMALTLTCMILTLTHLSIFPTLMQDDFKWSTCEHLKF